MPARNARKPAAKPRVGKAKSPKSPRKDGAPLRPARTVTPYLAVADAEAALAWYQEAFGAKVSARQLAPGGKVMHAAIEIGDSTVFLSDVFPGSDLQEPLTLGGTGVNLHIHHPDADRLWQQAVDAGATVTVQLANQFWGERYGKLTDPFGHSWAIAAEADLTADEAERMQSQALRMLGGGAHLKVEPSQRRDRRPKGERGA